MSEEPLENRHELESEVEKEKGLSKKNIARIANAVQVTICLLVSTSVS